MNQALLEQRLAELPLYSYFFTSPSQLEFSPRVRWICEHECGQYGQSWACPPGVGTVEECQAHCMRYQTCLVIATITEVTDIANLEETLSNISPSEEPCRYYLLTGYIQGMLEALTMLTTVEDGKRFKIKLEQFRQNLLLSGDYDATGNYKQAVKKTAV